MSPFLLLAPLVTGVASLAHLGYVYFGAVQRNASKVVQGLIGTTPFPLTVWAYSSFDENAGKGFCLLLIAVVVMFGSLYFYDDPQVDW